MLDVDALMIGKFGQLAARLFARQSMRPRMAADARHPQMNRPLLGKTGPTSLEVGPVPIRSGVKSDQISV